MTAQAQCDLEWEGVLLEHASARTKMIDSIGHHVPVLCFICELESATRAHCQVEQPFPAGHEKQCEAAARRLRKGSRVTFQAPSVGIRLLVGNATHVHLHETPSPAAASPEEFALS